MGTTIIDSFSQTWAQNAKPYQWAPTQYALGWSTVGDTPPTVSQFDGVANKQDLKSNYLYAQLKKVFDNAGIKPNDNDATSLLNSVMTIANIATQAEANAGKDDRKIMTPRKVADALANYTSTKFASNHQYTKLPNGIILQWFYADYKDSDGANGAIISLPFAFPNDFFRCVSSDVGSGVNSTACSPVDNKSLRCWGKSVGGLARTGINIFAIGN